MIPAFKFHAYIRCFVGAVANGDRRDKGCWLGLDSQPNRKYPEFGTDIQMQTTVGNRSTHLEPTPMRRLTGLITLAGIMAFGVGVHTLESAEQKPSSKKHVLDFQVIDFNTNKPLSNVTLRILLNGKESEQKTGEQGRATIVIPPGEMPSLTIGAKLEDYVSKVIDWSAEQPPFEIPSEYTMAILRHNTSSSDMSPLHRAAMQGDKELVELLLAKDVDVNAVNALYNGAYTPLLLAAYHRHSEIAELLIAHGAKVDIFTAAALDDAQRVETMLKENPKLINVRHQNWATPLHEAASRGAVRVTELLLARGADVNVTADWGWTPLHLAARYQGPGHKDVVELLLAHGADVTLKEKYCGRSPLHWAIYGNKNDLAEILLSKGADANAKDAEGQTLLCDAVERENTELVSLLLSKGSDANAQGSKGQTPLRLAVQKGNKAVVLLLANKGADLQAKDKEGYDALLWAAWNGHGEVGEVLLEKGAVADIFAAAMLGKLDRVDQCLKQNPELVSATLKFPRDENKKAHSLADFLEDSGPTPLHWAVVQDRKLVAKSLLEHGANVNAADEFGATSLHLAVKYGFMEMAEFLLDHKADPELKDARGNTPFGSNSAQKIKDLRNMLKQIGLKE